MGTDFLKNLTDTYDRKARLYPSLLALIPPIGVLVGLYAVNFQIKDGWAGLLATFGVFYLMASITRERGKRLEKGLFESWGGRPTTQLLRHRDQTIDPITKARYHAFLSNQINVAFPTASEEQDNPSSADHIYASSVKWLIDQTRDTKKFYLLFYELINYGFRRNCFGLKPIALITSCGSIMWVLFACGVITLNGLDTDAIASLPDRAWASVIVSTTMFTVWSLFITQKTVRAAAFIYANKLLMTCDVLSQNTASKTKNKQLQTKPGAM